MRKVQTGLFLAALLVSLGTQSSHGMPEKTAYVATYAGWLTYRDTTDKDQATLGGLYGSAGQGAHWLESEVDYTDIRNATAAGTRQWDASLAYANYSLTGWRLRLGGHLIQGNDTMTRNGLTLFGGVRYLVPYCWNLGLEGYQTNYPRYDSGLHVTQWTEHFGLSLWRGKTWNLWNDLRFHRIVASEDTGFGKGAFLSTEDRITWYWAKTSVAVFGWLGEQVFAARNDGLTVLNIAEKHKNGVGIEATHAVTDQITVKGVVGRESFEERESDRDASAGMVLGMLVIGF